MDKITAVWANDAHTILLVTYEVSDWTWDDVAQSVLLTNEMINSENHVVDVVVDMRRCQVLPKGGTAFKVIQQARDTRPPRHGCFVIVGLRGAIAKLVRLLQRIPSPSQREIFLTETVDEALELLQQRTNEPPT